MSAAATVNNIRAAASRHSLPLPSQFSNAVAALETRYAPIPYDEPGNLADAVADAIGAGVDPFGSEQVRLILLRRNFHPAVSQALDTARENALAALLGTHRAEILGALRPRWTELGGILSHAAEKLPGASFQRPSDVATVGTDEKALTLWAAGHAATRELDAIASISAKFVPIGRPDYSCLIGAPLTAGQYDQLVALGMQRVVWAPALIGVKLDLADLAELRDRNVTLENARAALAIAGQHKGGYLRAF